MDIYRTWTLYLMVSYGFLSLCCTALDDCQKVDDCSCRLSNGQEINIESLGNHGASAPRFGYVAAGAWKYAYNPCYAWSDGSSCQNVVACQEGATDPSEKFAIGDATPATWTQENNNYVVKYTSIGGGSVRTSVVVLKCDMSATQPSLLRFGSKPDPQDPGTTLYDFTLISKCCCPGECGSMIPSQQPTNPFHPTNPSPGGISPGSVLCIIVSVLIVVYLVSGLLFMKFVRHAEGTEIIPNRNIWAGLFYSIRDGCVFIFSCGKRSGYDTMK